MANVAEFKRIKMDFKTEHVKKLPKLQVAPQNPLLQLQLPSVALQLPPSQFGEHAETEVLKCENYTKKIKCKIINHHESSYL